MHNTFHYHEMIMKLRNFFQLQKGYVEVPAQSRLSILAACEDPKTVATFTLQGTRKYPLPQTNQPWLEYELLTNPGVPGFFSAGTSYRDEPNPEPGRHQRVFPIFEFEGKGDIEDLKQIETELLVYLGFEAPITVDYEDMCSRYQTREIKSVQENQMASELSNSIILQRFPLRSHPFFNMKHVGNGIYNKVDVILHGNETIGSAERSCDIEEMRDLFYATSNGDYAKLLFQQFGKDRVLKELDEFLALPQFPRYGGGIGMTRLEVAMEKAGLFEPHPDIINRPKYAQTIAI